MRIARHPRAAIALVALALFAVYLLSMPRTVVGEDDGLFIMAAWFGGLAHPPGYPLYVMINYLLLQLPGLAPAASVHGVTALFGAATCALVGLCIVRLGASVAAATGAMALLGLSSLFWSQSIIADVYSLNSFLFMLVLAALLSLARRLDADAAVSSLSLFTTGLAAGLALSNHWPLFVLASPGLALIGLPLLLRFRQCLPWLLAGVFLGLLPYAWLFVRSGSEFVFMGPVADLQDLWFYLSRQAYSEIDSSAMHQAGDSWRFAGFLAKSWLLGFGLLGAFFLGLGVIGQRRYLRNNEVLGLLLIVVCCGPLLVGLLSFEYNEMYRAVISVYFLPVVCVLAIWSGLGIDQLQRVISARNYSAWILNLAVAVAVAAVFIGSSQDNWRSDDSWAESYALTVLDLVPEDAMLVADDDFSSAPIGYVHHVQQIKPDLRLLNSYGLLYPSAAAAPQEYTAQGRREYLQEIIASSESRVWFTERPELDMGVGSNGLLFWHYPDRGKAHFSVMYDDRVIDYLLQVAASTGQGQVWTKIHRQRLLEAALPSLLLLLEEEGLPRVADIQALLEATVRPAAGKIALARNLIELDRRQSFGGAGYWLSEAEKQGGELSRYNRVNLYLLQAQLAAKDSAQARQLAERALSAWPDPANPAHRFLRALDAPPA